MAAGKLDICVEQGATFSLQMSFTDSNGSALDVSGWTFVGQIRSTYSAALVAATFDFSAGSADNIVIATIPASGTSAIPVQPATSVRRQPTLMTYDFDATQDDGSVVRVLQGIATISPEVTK